MDPFPPNIERIAAAPFSLDAARRRQAPEAHTAGLSMTDLQPLLHLAERAARRHPRLELAAGSAIPEPTPTQVTDARDRFLGRLTKDLAAAPRLLFVPPAAGQPSMALLQRVTRLFPRHDDGPRGA